MNNESAQDMIYVDETDASDMVPRERSRLKRGDGAKKRQQQRLPLQMANFQINQIIYPVKTKRGIKHKP